MIYKKMISYLMREVAIPVKQEFKEMHPAAGTGVEISGPFP